MPVDPPSEERVLSYFDALSNWGRWGDQDVLGTLNFIDDRKRAQAAALVRDGASISCSRLIRYPGPYGVLRGANPTVTMLQSGEPYAAGKLGPDPHELQWAAEHIAFAFHGTVFTHLDDLSHVFWNGSMYNARPSSLVTAAEGATVQSADALQDGVIARGVLLDIARWKGQRTLDPDDHVFPADLEACSEAQEVEVREGDVLLLRTGHGAVIDAAADGDWPVEASGYNAACLPWLHERSVALIGSDAINDPTSRGYTRIAAPIHQVALVAMGLRLLDNAHLERLAAECAGRGRWEFCLSFSPLRLERGTGSPVNPIAIF